MAKTKVLALTLILGMLLPTAAFADNAAWEWTTTGIESGHGDWTFGEVFIPTRDITVDFLGSYIPTSGMFDVHPVSIWNGTSGALVASSTITSASGVLDCPFPIQHDLPSHPACGADL